jgi:hypothetical protein
MRNHIDFLRLTLALGGADGAARHPSPNQDTRHQYWPLTFTGIQLEFPTFYAV